jgi:DNA-binding IclR family transcriptional regulator
VGFRNPALTTALGRAILCQKYLDFDSLAQAFPTAIFERTRHTKTALAEIWLELVEARKRGFAREINEYVLGTSCLGVAVLRGHKPIAAISVTGPSDRLDGKNEKLLMAALRKYVTPRLPTGLSLQMPTENAPRRPAGTGRALYALSR